MPERNLDTSQVLQGRFELDKMQVSLSNMLCLQQKSKF